MLPALKYMVRHYGRNYIVISEKSECGRLRFYAMIELLYGANRFTVTVRKRELFYDAYYMSERSVEEGYGWGRWNRKYLYVV